jgi:hypothetical protein
MKVRHIFSRICYVGGVVWVAEVPGLSKAIREGLTLETGNRIEILNLLNLKCYSSCTITASANYRTVH